MSEPEISNLARRLAEQNNVDWRRLSGTGPHGSVVERDVLDFLARVMAGEEDVDPTPEPVPEGMSSWSEAGVVDPGARAGAPGPWEQDGMAAAHDAAREAEGPGEPAIVATDEAEAGFMDRAAEAPVAGGAHEPAFAGEAGEALPDDVFLFDDDDDVEYAHGGQRPAEADASTERHVGARADASHAGAAPPEMDDDLLVVSDDDLLDVEPDAPGAAEPAPTVHPLQMQGAAPEAAGEWGGELRLDADPYLPPAEAPLEIWESEPAGTVTHPGADVFEEPPDESAPFETGPFLGEESWSPPEPEAASAGTPGFGFAVDIEAEGADEGPAGAEALQFGSLEEHPGSGFAPEVQALDGGTEEELGYPDQFAVEPGPAPVDEPPEPFLEPEPVLEPLTAARDEAEEGASAPLPVDLPLAKTPGLLRRNLDLSALAAAQLAVGRELGAEGPLDVAPFLLRAVVKAANDIGVEGGQVALAQLSPRLMLRRVDGAASRPFVDLVEELSRAGAEEDEVALVAVDLSLLDVDEALLDVGAPTVTLGRILYDSDVGGYRSTLALTGDLPLDVGARLLARVAELLTTPIRLLV